MANKTPPAKLAQIKAANNLKRQTNQILTFEWRKAHPCVKCGESDPHLLQFVHRAGEDRKFSLGAVNTHSRETVLAEIAKCDIICTRCRKGAPKPKKATAGKPKQGHVLGKEAWAAISAVEKPLLLHSRTAAPTSAMEDWEREEPLLLHSRTAAPRALALAGSTPGADAINDGAAPFSELELSDFEKGILASIPKSAEVAKLEDWER